LILKPKRLGNVKYALEDYSSITVSSVHVHQQKKKMMMKRIASMKIWIGLMSAQKGTLK